jgi:mRNA interferase RelE/StbE
MFSLEFSRPANRFFQKLPKEDKLMISKKLFSIQENPFHYLKKLKGSKLWRLRIKDYRAIIEVVISGQRIIILRIGHRKNVYSE